MFLTERDFFSSSVQRINLLFIAQTRIIGTFRENDVFEHLFFFVKFREIGRRRRKGQLEKLIFEQWNNPRNTRTRKLTSRTNRVVLRRLSSRRRDIFFISFPRQAPARMVANCPRFQKLCAGYVLMAIPRESRETHVPYKRQTPFLNRMPAGRPDYMLCRLQSTDFEMTCRWRTFSGRSTIPVTIVRPPFRPSDRDRRVVNHRSTVATRFAIRRPAAGSRGPFANRLSGPERSSGRQRKY